MVDGVDKIMKALRPKKDFIADNMELICDLTQWYSVNINSDYRQLKEGIDTDNIENWLVESITLTVPKTQGLDVKHLHRLFALGFDIADIDYEEPNFIIKVEMKD